MDGSSCKVLWGVGKEDHKDGLSKVFWILGDVWELVVFDEGLVVQEGEEVT